jgi:hydroxylamine reductase
LKEILLYSLRGVAAYAYHAALLGQEDESVYSFIQEAMASLIGPGKGMDEWLGLVLKSGEINLRAMELLDTGNTPTVVQATPLDVCSHWLQNISIYSSTIIIHQIFGILPILF